MKPKFSTSDLVSVLVLLGLIVLGVLGICCRRPGADWINNTILALTAFVLLWYTRETAAMKAEAAKQNRLQTRPILVLVFANNTPFLRNEGRGPALNATVSEFVVRSILGGDRPLNNEHYEFVLPPFIPTDSNHELQMYRSNPEKGTKGTLSQPDIFFQLEKRITIAVSYEDIEAGAYVSRIEIQSGMTKRISFESSSQRK